MSKVELSLIRAFKRFKSGFMVICGYRSVGTEVMDIKDETVYLVKGLRSKLADVIGEDKLPLPVAMTLLPFGDKIVYSGYIKEIAIDFGNNLAEMVIAVQRTKEDQKEFQMI